MNMTTTELAEKLMLKTLNSGAEREISSCYIGDLLSQVLGSCGDGDAWITVQSSMNVVAVAQMVDAACVIIAESMPVSDEVIKKANDEELPVFSSSKNSFTLALEIAKLLGI